MINQDSQLQGIVLDDTTTYGETISSSFVLDHTMPSINHNQLGFNAIDVEKMNSNLSEEDEEMFKLMSIFSKLGPYLQKSLEPESKKSIYDLKTNLPPPSIFKRKQNCGLKASMM
jgi:hypothetical protein